MEPGRKLDQRRGLKDPLAPAETVGKACVSGKCIWNRRGEPFDFKAVSIATSTHGTSLSLFLLLSPRLLSSFRTCFN